MSKDLVQIWEQTITIPTYPAGKPDSNPMFLEKRVYQGSSGVVYPYPVIETISDTKEDRQYTVVFLENQYLKIMIMPSLGGRVQMALDKTNDFNFIYYNQVIKPALVGLAGPWISGGIEFNWPQHHRPSTFEPADFTIEKHPDGSATLWVGEIERMFRTKCLTGFTLHPNRAYLEIKVKLYNRTEVPQTFLWWANPAMHVNEDYQSIFPPDVHAVMDHGKRDVSRFPIATGTYYKVDYSAGVDISRYKNIPVPTSYMVYHSNYNFFGGYDHGKKAGMLHVANHHVCPGKKQWVWGSGDFGKAWDRNLTDEDGPYVELMAGVYTDNQPDFSWLMPFEEKCFTQFFMPYKQVGAVKNATIEAAVNLEIIDHQAVIGVYVTLPQKGLCIRLEDGAKLLLDAVVDLSPIQAFEKTVSIQETNGQDLMLKVVSADGRQLVSYRPRPEKLEKLPEPARAIGDPKSVKTTEELYLAGLHLEQYRHATFRPEDYYQEALERDPDDIRCNNAMGLLLYRQGQFDKAESYFRKAIFRQIRHNPNPYDGEPYYNLGITLKMQGRLDEAFDALFKSVWNSAWQESGYFCLAQIAAIKGDFYDALDYVERSLIRSFHHQKARHLKIMLLRKTGQFEKAQKEINLATELDKLDFGALNEYALAAELHGLTAEALKIRQDLKTKMRDNANTYLEISQDYAQAGFYQDARDLLLRLTKNTQAPEDVYPMIWYYLAFYADKMQDSQKAGIYFQYAADANPGTCFAHHLESIEILQTAITRNSKDAKALYYLGNLWYSRRQYDNAIDCWEQSCLAGPTFPTAHRNLGLAYFNKRNAAEEARREYETAFSLNSSDARVLFELDQLYKKLCFAPEKRLELLRLYVEVVALRDDLYLEYIQLHNLIGEYEKAFKLLTSRKFHPWEGGEGKVTGAYVFALLEMARQCLMQKQPDKAIEFLLKAKEYPDNLGEGKLHGHRENDIDYYLGLAYEKLGHPDKSLEAFAQATLGDTEPSGVMFYNDQPADQIYYQGLAFEKIGNAEKARSCFNRLISYGEKHWFDEMKIDYFAVSLPDFLVFEENLNKRNQIYCRYLMGLGHLGLGQINNAQAEFEEILRHDPAHIGAAGYLRLIQNISFFHG